MPQTIAFKPAIDRAVAATSRTAVIATTAFLTLIDLFAAQAVLPSLVKAYQVSPAVMGLAVNACTLGMAIASLLVALLSARIDRRSGIVVALCVLAVPTVLLGFAPDIFSFAALRVVQGLCMAAAFTLMLAYIGENCASNVASSAFAAYIVGNVGSNLFGRIASAALVDHYGLTINFAVLALLNLAGAALVLATIRSARRPAMTYAVGGGWAGVSKALSRMELRAGFLIGFCILFAFIGTFTFVNFVLVRPPISLGPMELGFVYLVFAPSLVTTLFVGSFVQSFGPRRALLSGLAVAAAGLPMLLAARIDVVLLGLSLVAVGTFFAQAVASGYIGSRGGEERGAASGLYLASYFSGGLVGTAVLGFVFQNFGWPACLAGIGAAIGVAAVTSRNLR